MEKRVTIASWLFLIGSGLFLIDAVSEIVDRFSLMSVLHLSEGILFLVGSLFFMPHSQNESINELKSESKQKQDVKLDNPKKDEIDRTLEISLEPIAMSSSKNIVGANTETANDRLFNHYSERH